MIKQASQEDRIASLYALVASPLAYEFKTSTEKDIHFIGLGSAGCKVLQYFRNK